MLGHIITQTLLQMTCKPGCSQTLCALATSSSSSMTTQSTLLGLSIPAVTFLPPLHTCSPVPCGIYVLHAGLSSCGAAELLSKFCHCCLYSVQSHVVGIYMLHAGLSSCGAAELLSELDDAVSDTIGEHPPLPAAFVIGCTCSMFPRWCTCTVTSDAKLPSDVVTSAQVPMSTGTIPCAAM